MSRKRKEPTTNQSSTILDFFGKGTAGSNSRDTKKLKTNGALPRRKSIPHVKRELPEDIIVIEDSDDDSDVEISAIRPAPRPLQTGSNAKCGGSRDAAVGCGREVPLPASLLADSSAHTSS